MSSNKTDPVKKHVKHSEEKEKKPDEEEKNKHKKSSAPPPKAVLTQENVKKKSGEGKKKKKELTANHVEVVPPQKNQSRPCIKVSGTSTSAANQLLLVPKAEKETFRSISPDKKNSFLREVPTRDFDEESEREEEDDFIVYDTSDGDYDENDEDNEDDEDDEDDEKDSGNEESLESGDDVRLDLLTDEQYERMIERVTSNVQERRSKNPPEKFYDYLLNKYGKKDTRDQGTH